MDNSLQRLLYIYYLKYNQATKYHILRQNMNYCTLLISFQSTESFHLCQALKSEDDIASFFYSIIGILKKAVQWDQGSDIEYVCSIMEDESLGSPLRRMIKLNRR